MTELVAAGGCYNSMRYAREGSTANTRDWIAAYNTAGQITTAQNLILAVCVDADDMNDATSATFKIQWQNVSDAGSWTDLGTTGEIRYASSSTTLTNNNTVALAADSGGHVVNCVNKGWSARRGLELVNRNGFTRTVVQDAWEEYHWAIDITNADVANQDAYAFRLTTSAAVVIGTMSGNLTVVTAGKITGTTKNADRSAAVGGVTVTAYLSDGAGSDPKPEGAHIDQVVSHATTGVYSLTNSIASGADYFLHFYKDDTNDLSDGSGPVTAVDV